ncbi:hypothetical protein MKEN_00186300 [Mycena kentingensis (nom. inval.)]|nr:hypothetical protein MKEN_00186300 [Mycena kentingensis (nom. inval.)]
MPPVHLRNPHPRLPSAEASETPLAPLVLLSFAHDHPVFNQTPTNPKLLQITMATKFVAFFASLANNESDSESKMEMTASASASSLASLDIPGAWKTSFAAGGKAPKASRRVKKNPFQPISPGQIPTTPSAYKTSATITITTPSFDSTVSNGSAGVFPPASYPSSDEVEIPLFGTSFSTASNKDLPAEGCDTTCKPSTQCPAAHPPAASPPTPVASTIATLPAPTASTPKLSLYGDRRAPGVSSALRPQVTSTDTTASPSSSSGATPSPAPQTPSRRTLNVTRSATKTRNALKGKVSLQRRSSLLRIYALTRNGVQATKDRLLREKQQREQQAEEERQREREQQYNEAMRALQEDRKKQMAEQVARTRQRYGFSKAPVSRLGIPDWQETSPEPASLDFDPLSVTMRAPSPEPMELEWEML